MTMYAIEQQLKDKGYWISKTFIHNFEAREYAKKERESGYYARVVEYSTNVRGLHDYAVWTKKKEEKGD